jgi:protein ImuA
MMHAGREHLLADLRKQVEGIERGRALRRDALPFGMPDIDRHLPAGGLKLGAVHEVLEAGPAADHAALASLFVAGHFAKLTGPVLWCLRGRDLFAPALARVGLHPDRVIYAETWKDAEVLPVMEEGLRHRGLAGVVGEIGRLPLTASRRLQLAAESTGTLAFAIRRWRGGTERQLGEASAALTRWRISPGQAPPLPAPGLGRARWLVELVRAKGAEPRSWILEACDAKGRLGLPADLADGQVAPHEGRRLAVG